jgi:sugar O-acyltransferase (sialic acid O-acetyltransferase NeuD family)
MSDLIVIGASGLAREALAVVRETGSHTPVGVLDDSPATLGASFDGVPVAGPLSELSRFPHAEVLLCVGAGAAREAIARRLRESELGGARIRFATVVDPSVRNPDACPIGAGSIVLAQVSITAHARLGAHVVVMPNCTITHDDVLDDFATLASGVSLGGGALVGRAAYLGMNAVVLPGVRIGERAVVGAGAVVLDDVPPDETWAGVPAHRLGARVSA